MVAKERVILFNDIKSSSILWKKYKEKGMIPALDKFNNLMVKLVKKYKGMILKTIGDSYMIMFNTFDQAFSFCIDTINSLMYKPIKLQNISGKDTIKIRTGFCVGKVSHKTMTIQGKKLMDVFGQAVNKASRMESKVSPVLGFALCRDDNKPINFDKYYKKYNIVIKNIKYKQVCDKINRSKRIMSSVQLAYECKLESDLHGVGEVNAYSVSIKQ
jgi:hypothetical protein